MVQVLFVCTGNICRSPMAEAVFRQMVAEEGLSDRIAVDSAGTGSWHVGEPPHPGTLKVLRRESIPTEGLVARAISPADFDRFDYIVALDSGHMAQLRRMARPGCRARLRMMMEGIPESPGADVPDPYYTGQFDLVYEMIRKGCRALLDEVRRR
ncbi:MAG: low molecular weight protein-tyrosine-phosphatase [Bacillota bacterium]